MVRERCEAISGLDHGTWKSKVGKHPFYFINGVTGLVRYLLALQDPSGVFPSEQLDPLGLIANSVQPVIPVVVLCNKRSLASCLAAWMCEREVEQVQFGVLCQQIQCLGLRNILDRCSCSPVRYEG